MPTLHNTRQDKNKYGYLRFKVSVSAVVKGFKVVRNFFRKKRGGK